ncbi:MAG: glycosyltransferase [Conexivisphaerales archaeon]
MIFSIFFIDSRIKSSLILHESFEPSGYGKVLGGILYSLLNIGIRRNLNIISISNITKLNTIEKVRDKIRVIPPIAFENLSSINNKEKSIILDTRWTQDREPLFLLGIMEKLKNVKFYMCGSFPNESLEGEFITELKRMSLDKTCELHLGVSGEEMNMLYDRSMILMRWSGLSEKGNSVAVMDSISHECIPIVDANLGEMPDIIKKEISPILVVERREEAFAEVAIKILENEELYNRLREKIKELKIKMSWKSYSESLLKIV